MPALQRHSTGFVSYDVLFVNNGSWDQSPELLAELKKTDPRVKILSLSRNFGHQGAVTAGLDYCSGRAVVVMDGDLQDPPELLPEMINLWKSGFHVVYGVRRDRKEDWARRSSYYLFYRILKYLAKIDIPPDAGDFCLMDRRVVKALRELPEQHRFTRGLRVWVGFRHIGLPYERAARHGGKSKYNWSDYTQICCRWDAGVFGISPQTGDLPGVVFVTPRRVLPCLCYCRKAERAGVASGMDIDYRFDTLYGWRSVTRAWCHR